MRNPKMRKGLHFTHSLLHRMNATKAEMALYDSTEKGGSRLQSLSADSSTDVDGSRKGVFYCCNE